jgi:hypothetical protein
MEFLSVDVHREGFKISGWLWKEGEGVKKVENFVDVING